MTERMKFERLPESEYKDRIPENLDRGYEPSDELKMKRLEKNDPRPGELMEVESGKYEKTTIYRIARKVRKARNLCVDPINASPFGICGKLMYIGNVEGKR